MKTGKKRKVILSVTSLLLIFTVFLSSLSMQVFAAEANEFGASPAGDNITKDLDASSHFYLNSILPENELGQSSSPVISLTDKLLFRFHFSVPETLDLKSGDYYHMELPEYLQIEKGSWKLEATVEKTKKNDGSTTGSDPPSSGNQDDEETNALKTDSDSLNNHTDADDKGTQTPSSNTANHSDSDDKNNEDSIPNSTSTDDSSDKKESGSEDTPKVPSEDTTPKKEDDLNNDPSKSTNEEKEELDLQQIAPLALGNGSGNKENEVETTEETITIGEVRIEGQDFYLEFTHDDYSDLSNIKGYFDADISFRPDMIEVDEDGNFSVKLGDTTIDLKTDEKPAKGTIRLKKDGEFTETRDGILWTVTVTPNEMDAEGYTFEDTLNIDSFFYKEGTFKINGVAATPEITKSGKDQTLRYTFAEGTTATQTITFETTISDSKLNAIAGMTSSIDQNKLTLTNTAFLKKAGEQNQSASASVVLRPAGISKTGTQNGDEITWKITVNNGNWTQPLTDAYVRDPLINQNLVPEKLTYTMGGETKQIPEESAKGNSPVYYTYSAEKVLEVHFVDTLTQACTISVTTTPNPGVAVANIQNTATLHGKYAFGKQIGNSKGVSATATINYIGNQGSITKTGVKYDSTTAQMTWNIKVKASLEDAIVQDVLETSTSNANGQKFVSVSLDGGATTIPEKAEVDGKTPYYTLTPNGTKENLSIHLGETNGEEISLTLVTQLTNPKVYGGNGGTGGTGAFGGSTTVSNTVKLYNGGDNLISESTDSFAVNTFTVNKRKAGDYDAKTHTMLWRIEVNHNGMVMKEVNILDQLPDGVIPDASYGNGGFQIYQATANPNGAHGPSIGKWSGWLNAGAEVENPTALVELKDNGVTTGGNHSYTFSFKKTIDQPYIIYFQTKVTDEYLAKISSGQKGKNVRNSATLNAKDKNGVVLPKGMDYEDISISGVQSMLEKKGTVNQKNGKPDGTVTWTITANSNFAQLADGATVKEAKVKDTIQSPQELTAVSIVETKKGNATGTSLDIGQLAAENKIEYPSKENGNQFIFILPDPSAKYVIQLTTRLTTTADSVSNSASIEGIYTKTVTAEKLKGVAVAGGGASVDEATGSITIHKVDTATGAPLQGATFLLMGEDSSVGKTAYTNGSGIAKFEKVPTGTYHLTEVTAPNGYQFEAIRKWTVMVSKNGTVEVDLTQDNAVQQGNVIKLKIGNSKIDAQVMFTKVDDLGEAVAGAEFSIKRQGSQAVLKTAISNETGVVTFNGLSSGTYVIEETKAPEGYLRNEETFTVTVEANTGKVTYDIKDKAGISETNGMPQVVNPRIKGDLILVKTNEDGSEPLKGAVFNLIHEETGALKQATSDADGQVKFEDVAYGNYRIEEETAPIGYQKSDEIIYVKKERFQAQSKQVIELGNFANKKEETPPEPVDPTPPDPVDPTPPTPPTPDRPNTHPPDEVTPPVEIPDPDVPLGPGPDTPTTEIPEEEVPLGPAPEDPIVEIEDPEVPLAPAPHTPVNPATPTRPVGPEQPVFIIEDEMVPLAGLPDFAAPQTGDDSNLWLYSTLAVLSMAGIMVLILKKAKSKK